MAVGVYVAGHVEIGEETYVGIPTEKVKYHVERNKEHI